MKAVYRNKALKYHGRIQFSLNAMVILLLALWVPVMIDKVMNFAEFKYGILRQPFPDWLGYVAIYALLVLEASTVVLLITEKTLRHGLYLSFFLMAMFTGYIAIALLGAWEKLPCGCGSVISGMTWTQHFFFNLFFLSISGWGIFLWHKLRDSITGGEAIPNASTSETPHIHRLQRE